MADEDISKLKIDKSAEVYRPGKRRKIMYIIVLLAFAVSLVFLYAKGVFSPAVEVETANVTKIYPSQAFTLLNASGYVVAERRAAVASKVTGRLVSLMVEEGSRVKKGEIIARLENEDVSAFRDQAAANLNAARYNLEQAQADLQDAMLTFNRYKTLIGQDYVSRADYDSAEARYKRASAGVNASGAAIKASAAALKGAEVSLEYTLIRAPFDAVVLTKNADIGDIITPLGAAANAKAAVVTIADMDSLQVEVDVSESSIHQVKIGQPCEILLDALSDLRFRGVVHMIVPTADRTKATILVKIRFIDKDKRILPEMSAKAAFLSREPTKEEENPLTALNAAALVDRNGKKEVFLIGGNKIIETPVTTGRQLGNLTEVLSGVKPGDQVVLRPLDRMRNGMRIKVAEK